MTFLPCLFLFYGVHFHGFFFLFLLNYNVMQWTSGVAYCECFVWENYYYVYFIYCVTHSQTDEAVNERQSLKHYLQSEHKDKKKSVNAIIESELMKEKLLASFKKYKIKAEDRIDKLMTK